MKISFLIANLVITSVCFGSKQPIKRERSLSIENILKNKKNDATVIQTVDECANEIEAEARNLYNKKSPTAEESLQQKKLLADSIHLRCIEQLLKSQQDKETFSN